MERALAVTAAKQSAAGSPSRPSAGGSGSFPSTQWSLILDAQVDTDTKSRSALESLCRAYWRPLYAYVRRQGRGHHDAEDVTQQFIAHLLAADRLQRARPERGRFRTFLLTGLRNFLTSDWRRTQTVKRGGGARAVSLEPAHASDSSEPELADPALTPERAFDRSWAEGMIEQAAMDLRAEYEGSGRARIFAVMAPLIWGADGDDAVTAGAAAAGVTPNAFRVALHRARRRLGERLRAQVAATVADPGEIDGELHHLMEAMSGMDASP